MEHFLRVEDAVTNLPSSPTNSFMADEVASICPLITPPTNDLINPLPENSETNYAMGEELVTMLEKVRDENKTAEDSASSSSSALAEPSCTQLLNHRNIYHHITKDEETAAKESNGKTQPLQLTFKNPPENYFFMSWNWLLIRKVLLWFFLSGLMAMVALVIAMISSLPRTCNPPTLWYQGSVMYEIFPASFSDSNNDMIGDLKGIIQKSDYIESLGVKSVRLNSIFATQHYPEDYQNVTTLLEIAKPLGDIKDFQILVHQLHLRNISIILDIPIHPTFKQLSANILSNYQPFNNSMNFDPSVEFLKQIPANDSIENILIYWLEKGVDGFYLKGLEYFINDLNFAQYLRRWKKLLGENRVLIVNENLINSISFPLINVVVNNVDLVEIRLQIDAGVKRVSKQLKSIQNGTLFTKPGRPWILWTLGDVTSNRLANILPYYNATLGATLLQLMLPGTPSIFYGDEIGLQQISDPDGDRNDLKHLHQLTAMVWSNKQSGVLSWMHGEKTINNFEQINLIEKLINLRSQSPSIYVNSVYKDGGNKANFEVKYSHSDFLVIQRWYPRRKSYVVVSNLGNKQITADLSTLLYSGEVVIGPKTDSKHSSVSFKSISLWPGESVVILLH